MQIGYIPMHLQVHTLSAGRSGVPPIWRDSLSTATTMRDMDMHGVILVRRMSRCNNRYDARLQDTRYNIQARHSNMQRFCSYGVVGSECI